MSVISCDELLKIQLYMKKCGWRYFDTTHPRRPTIKELENMVDSVVSSLKEIKNGEIHCGGFVAFYGDDGEVCVRFDRSFYHIAF